MRYAALAGLGYVAGLLLGAAPLAVHAQATDESKRDCEARAAAPAKPGTATEKGPDSGTKNMGATGWSGGGLGGSHNETSPSGPTAESKTEHPPTAKGLDPTKPERNGAAPC